MSKICYQICAEDLLKKKKGKKSMSIYGKTQEENLNLLKKLYITLKSLGCKYTHI